VRFGSRPSRLVMRSYSSGVRPCARIKSLVWGSLILGTLYKTERATRAGHCKMKIENANCKLLSHNLQFALFNFHFAISPFRQEALASSARVSANEQKITRPSALLSNSSLARSGCGISPSTLRPRLQIPAMLSIDPFGLAPAVTAPFGSEYLKMILLSR